MPWPDIKLNDGSLLPSIAYGRIYWVDEDTIADDIGKAIDVGFKHLDTAQGERSVPQMRQEARVISQGSDGYTI